MEVMLSLSPPSTSIVPYVNSLDPDETPSDSASHLDPSCLHYGTLVVLGRLRVKDQYNLYSFVFNIAGLQILALYLRKMST